MADYNKLRFLPGPVGSAIADVAEMDQKNPPQAGDSFPQSVGRTTRALVDQTGRNAVRTAGAIAGAASYVPREFYAGFTGTPAPTPSQTSNAVATATGELPRAQAIPGTPGYRDLEKNPPRPDMGAYDGEAVSSPALKNVGAFDQNMQNGSIKVVTQDAGYPGARGTMTSGLPRAQAQPYEFANFNTIQGGDAGSGGGKFEMFNPGVAKQLTDLSTRADALLGSRSMVDNWRGRQAAKMRDRMMLSEAAMGNTRVGAAQARASMLASQASALRAANEVPLAQMHDYTTQRGQDVTGEGQRLQAETSRYNTDTNADVQTRAQNIDAMRYAGDIATGQYTAKAVNAGDWESLRNLTESTGKYPPRESSAKIGTPDVYGGVWIAEPGKAPYYQRPGVDDKKALEKKTGQLYGK